jgi:hypothetical protein
MRKRRNYYGRYKRFNRKKDGRRPSFFRLLTLVTVNEVTLDDSTPRPFDHLEAGKRLDQAAEGRRAK